MVKKLALLAVLLGIALGAAAQDPESAYSGIFRGKLPGVYPYKYNGTYFWDRKEFLRGDILYNGKLYRDVLMNVDAARQELQVQPLEKASAMVVFRDQVAWFTMGPKQFVNLRYIGYPEAEEGFYEVLRDGEIPLLRRVAKTLRFDGSNGGLLLIGYEDPEFDVTVPNYFSLKETFYALEKGQLRKISKRNLGKRLKTAPGAPSLGFEDASWHTHRTTPPTGTVA